MITLPLLKILPQYLTLFFGLLYGQMAFGLTPIESLVLGTTKDDASVINSDPLNSVFGRDKNLENQSFKEHKKILALYRGFYEEGKNLSQHCLKDRKKIDYANPWDRLQMLRMAYADLQYIGLDLLARALPIYAKYFEFKAEDFQNLAENLVGNYCSANLTVISKKELLKNLLIFYKGDNRFRLPSVKGNPLFPDNLEKFVLEKKAREEEFKYSVELFKSLCSYGGDPTNPGAMSVLIKHPAIMAYVNRQMNGKEIEWEDLHNKLFITDTKTTSTLWCDQLICRKTNKDLFLSKAYLSIGGEDFYNDFKGLYCDDMLPHKIDPDDLDPKIKTMIKERTIDDENFLNAQFISLITGIPEFFFGLNKFNDAEDLLRTNIDTNWNHWAQKEVSDLNKDVFFEEPLTLDLIDRKYHFQKYNPQLTIGLDVNLGEFDRAVSMKGKLKISFRIKVPESYLKYHKKAMKDVDYLLTGHNEKREALINRLKLQLEKDIMATRDILITPPWKKDLASLVAKELSDRLEIMDDNVLSFSETKEKSITIELYYGLFALKYLNHQFNIK